ncbi:MAG TPA: DNA polymerase IV [Candidatus Dormibacteraeota bacterium]|nr:DNA polymerase IV [Candidatus Dormibacteraeota bacterium]
MQRVVMHVDLDAFYASVEQLRHPELRGKPVIVGGAGVPGERGVVAAASYEARPFGVRSAMPLSRAKRLCPQAVFVPCDFKAYREASKSVFDILDRYSPVIEPLALDEAYLDCTGQEALMGPPERVAVRLRDEVRARCGLDISIGVASSKLVAKVASELRKPRGLVVVSPGSEAGFLAPLPLAKLPGCGPATVSRLKRIGVRSVAELAALPDPLLGELFGQYGRALGAHARGIDASPVTPPGDPKSISREVTFDHDQVNQSKIRETALSLLQDVGQSLRAHGLSARTVTLKIRYQPFDTQSRQATLAFATDRDDELADAFRNLLEAQVDRSRPVRLIGAGVSNLEASSSQLNLLEDRSARRVQLDQQLDQLRDRYGDHVIARGVTVRPHQKDVRRDDLDTLRESS